MKTTDYFQVIIFICILLATSIPLGLWIAKVLQKDLQTEKEFIFKPLRWLEKLCYKTCSIDENSEMNWKEYAKALLLFNAFGFIFLFAILKLQNILPLNPEGLASLSNDLSFNTAMSFVTNTNWQSYSGESTLSYFSQMLGLTVQNFLSAATGIAVFAALVRGIARKQTNKIGNFWVDLTRATLYVLMPLSILLAVALSSQGVIQNFSAYKTIQTLESQTQTIPGGPAASQIAIKQLGTNGGGFFNTNSAHPFENPTPLSNFLEMLALLLIPAALTFTFGKMIGSLKQGLMLFSVMLSVWFLGFAVSAYYEYQNNPIYQTNLVMEGKEVRFGTINSILWSTATTVASNGSVNSMHSSLSPAAGGVAMFNIMLGEIIFGGVGSGMYGMLLFVLLTVFLSGLMIGRTPEYLGKKIESFEMQWAIFAILTPCAVILAGSAISLVLPSALSSLSSSTVHGFSEVIYAWTSATGNNGSAFAGLNANTPFYNYGLGIAMLIGRFIVIIPVLAIAGNLAQKNITPNNSGTFQTDNFIFTILLIGVILIVGALTFLPALSLGPIIEQLLLLQGKTL